MSRTTNTMYNHEQKEAYIKTEPSYTVALTNYFKRTAHSERLYKKDLADMNIQELEGTLEAMNVRRETTRRQTISMLKGYITWAKLTGRSSSADFSINTLSAKKIDFTKATRAQMFKDQEQLKEVLDKAVGRGNSDFEFKETKANWTYLTFWLLYMGMTLDELRELTKESIDKEAKLVICQGKKYPVDDNIVDLWEKVAASTHFEREGIKPYELVDSKYLFRPIVKKPNELIQCPVMRFTTLIVKTFDRYNEINKNKTPLRVSPLNIKISGIFYRLLQEEENGLKVTPEIVAQRMGFYDESKPLSNYTKWYNDYTSWKTAFEHII